MPLVIISCRRGVKNYGYVSSGGMYKDSDEVNLVARAMYCARADERTSLLHIPDTSFQMAAICMVCLAGAVHGG